MKKLSPSHLERLDKQFVWHPFTQMRDWQRSRNRVLVSGKGTVLKDQHGRSYLDANSSIWTNLHGHAHPKINRAITAQLRKVAHVSALGHANEPASLLAERLIRLARTALPQRGVTGNPKLTRVFFSDNGSTAMEVALKLAYAHAIRSGLSKHPRFLSLQGAYHGDTVGAVSLGHIDLFHKAYSQLLFRSDSVMAPYCYRCPFNRARPERADARDYRRCQWECVGQVEKRLQTAQRKGKPYAGFIFEPRMQGAAGMIPQPEGWLKRVAKLARQHRVLLIADEIMTGFGRTGTVFASHAEGVQPDFLSVAKGLSGGYLPMAATLTTQPVFDSFLGEYSEFKSFFHGHSFTANPAGCAASLASLELLEAPGAAASRQSLQQALSEGLKTLWTLPHVGDIRQVGLVVGIELVRNWKTREPYPLGAKAGIRVCEAMARGSVLTRPVGNVLVIMPPYCTTGSQLARILGVMHQSIRETL